MKAISEKIIEQYRILLDYIDNMCISTGNSKKEHIYAKVNIGEAILELQNIDDRFDDVELQAEYENIRALVNYCIKLNALSEQWPCIISLEKIRKVVRTTVSIQIAKHKILSTRQYLELRLPSNITNIAINTSYSKLEMASMIHFKSRINLYVKDRSQIKSLNNNAMWASDNDVLHIFERENEIEYGDI